MICPNCGEHMIEIERPPVWDCVECGYAEEKRES